MLEQDPVFAAFLCLWFIVLGACVGSFLNVIVYRLPRRKSIVHPPSHCPQCLCTIRWYDNIPVLSWIRLFGKCRMCRMPISIRYPSVEAVCSLLFGGVFLWIFLRYNFSVAYLIGLTVFYSTLGVCFLGIGLMMYDKRQR